MLLIECFSKFFTHDYPSLTYIYRHVVRREKRDCRLAETDQGDSKKHTVSVLHGMQGLSSCGRESGSYGSREWGLMPIQPGLEVPSLILENRRPPDDQLYLSDPVRFNPCQWRIVYTTPGGVTNGKIALLNIGGWFTTETMEVGAERVNQVLQELRAAIPDSVLHEESMWLNDADMNLQLPSFWIATHSDEPNQEIIGRMKAEEDRKKRAKRE